MQKCRYADALKCSECSAVYFQKCSKFVLAHSTFLSRSIRPFKYSSGVNPNSQVVWSRDIDTAKSAALKFALKKNTEIKRLTLSQVLNIVISSQEYEGSVFFIDYSTKAPGDPEKIKSCLSSFVESSQLQGHYISIYVNRNIPQFNLDYQLL